MAKRFTKEASQQLADFLYETGFELWNAGCTHRMHPSCNDEGFEVCSYGDPLHPERTFKTLEGALNYMEKKDEE